MNKKEIEALLDIARIMSDNGISIWADGGGIMDADGETLIKIGVDEEITGDDLLRKVNAIERWLIENFKGKS